MAAVKALKKAKQLHGKRILFPLQHYSSARTLSIFLQGADASLFKVLKNADMKPRLSYCYDNLDDYGYDPDDEYSNYWVIAPHFKEQDTKECYVIKSLVAHDKNDEEEDEDDDEEEDEDDEDEEDTHDGKPFKKVEARARFSDEDDPGYTGNEGGERKCTARVALLWIGSSAGVVGWGWMLVIDSLIDKREPNDRSIERK